MATGSGGPLTGGLGGGCWTFIAGLTVSAAALAALALYASHSHQPSNASPSPTATARTAAKQASVNVRCGGRSGQAVELRDPGFPDGDWTESAVGTTTLDTARFEVTHGSVGAGPDGNGYRATHLVFAGRGVIFVTHFQRSAVYDPLACGPISSLDVSFQLQNLGDPRPQQSVRFAVLQGGVVYGTNRLVTPAASASWTPVGAPGLHAEDFDDYLATGTRHPDFNTGSLEFGYVTANSCGLGLNAPPCVEEQTSAALAAWHVTVHR